MPGRQGLVAVLHLNSEPLREPLQLHGTLHHGSITAPPGISTRRPYSPRTCRMSNVQFALFYPGRLIRNQIKMFWRTCHNCLSLLMEHHRQGNGHPCTECLLTSDSLAQRFKTCKKNDSRLTAARLSSPCLKAGASRRVLVKIW
jgi:hypothetical protein